MRKHFDDLAVDLGLSEPPGNPSKTLRQSKRISIEDSIQIQST